MEVQCDTCGEVANAKAGERCGRAIYKPDETAVIQNCPGTYRDEPETTAGEAEKRRKWADEHTYTLTRLETVDVTYLVVADSIEGAVHAVQDCDELAIRERSEDAGAYFEAEPLRYLGVDGQYHYEGADTEPQRGKN